MVSVVVSLPRGPACCSTTRWTILPASPARRTCSDSCRGRPTRSRRRKRPLSSMSPTIVLDANGNPVLIAGAEGGPRIITAVLDIVRGVIDFHESVFAAVAQPRVHMQWLPDLVYAEPRAFAPERSNKAASDGVSLQVRGRRLRSQRGRGGSRRNEDGRSRSAHTDWLCNRSLVKRQGSVV